MGRVEREEWNSFSQHFLSTSLNGLYIALVLDCERTIMMQLQEIILRYSRLYFDVMQVTAELDWYD